MSFSLQQVSFAADDVFSRLGKSKSSSKKFLPRYLIQQERKKADTMDHMNALHGQMDDLENDFTSRMRRKKKSGDEEERRSGNPKDDSAGRLQYTMDDWDEEEQEFTTLRRYEYDENGVVRSIIEYNIKGANISAYFKEKGELIHPDDDEDDPFWGSFDDKVDWDQLLNDMVLGITVYEGEGEERRIAYVLSGFDDATGEPAEVQIYYYDDDGALRMVKGYNIEEAGLEFGDYKDPEPVLIEVDAIKNAVTEDDLTSVTLYDGDKDEEKPTHAFSGFDEDNVPMFLTMYEYEGEGEERKLIDVKTYDISDFAHFFQDSDFDWDDPALLNMILAEKMMELNIEDILQLLINNGLIAPGTSLDDLLALLGDGLESLDARGFLQLLINKELLFDEDGELIVGIEDALALLATSDVFEWLFEALSMEQWFELLQAKGLLAEGFGDLTDFIQALQAYLNANGLTFEDLRAEQFMDIFEAAGLLNTDAQTALNSVQEEIEDFLDVLTKDQFSDLLVRQGILRGTLPVDLMTMDAQTLLGRLVREGLLMDESGNIIATLEEALALLARLGILSDLLEDLDEEQWFELLEQLNLLDNSIADLAAFLAALQAYLDANSLTLEGLSAEEILELFATANLLNTDAAAALAAIQADINSLLAVLSTEQFVSLLTQNGLLSPNLPLDLFSLSGEALLRRLIDLGLLVDKDGNVIQSLQEALALLSQMGILQALMEELDEEQWFELLEQLNLLDNSIADLAAFLAALQAYLDANGLTLEGLSAEEILELFATANLLNTDAAAALAAIQTNIGDLLSVLSADQFVDVLTNEGLVESGLLS